MCMDAADGLTMAGMLADPLIQMMMRSDGVSDRAHAELWDRARDALAARAVVDGIRDAALSRRYRLQLVHG